jgi:hypothetical protein
MTSAFIYTAKFWDAVDRARDEIGDPRVFDEVMQRSLRIFAHACADASYPAIANDPNIVAACHKLTEGVVGLLFARAAGAKAWPFKLWAANREIDRAALVAHTAYDVLVDTVKKSMIANVGFDGTQEGFVEAMISTFGLDEPEEEAVEP